ncbi:MAG: hypothetical protein NW208_05590 [Bryobacter sp.]|nr:hypothetical protein [Bryobacter sp.]
MPFRLLGCCLWVASISAVWAQGGLSFSDSDPNRIVIENQHYLVHFSKQNGAILSLSARESGQNLTLGSEAECLWSVNLIRGNQNQFTGGCSFAPQAENTFDYRWNSQTKVLSFTYNSPNGSQPTALVSLVFSEQPYFDMQLQIQNRTSARLETIGWPGNLLLDRNAISAAYLPLLLPGVRLLPEFFAARRNVAQTYPGQLFFADLLAVEVNGTLLSMRGVNPDGPVQPVLIGLFDNESQRAGTYSTIHTLSARVESLENFSSPVVRLGVGGTVEALLASYRSDNGIDLYPSVAEKLGSRFAELARAPMVRADFQVFNRSLDQWTNDLDRIQQPSLLHLVGFQPGGHDKSYPDHLPPNPSFGSTKDLLNFSEAAKAKGLFLMPHTNYSWWDRASPTLGPLPESALTELMVQAPTGVPRVESYGNGTISNDGYVVSPSVPQTRARVQQAWQEWREAAGIDLVFLDQLGARNEVVDLNPQAQSPFEYHDQWINLTRSASDMHFATEGGWDRLANHLWGFFGSALSSQRSVFRPRDVQWGVGSPANELLGPGNWEPYPLATFLFHDKVFFYQHNLEISSYTETLEILTWNAIFGYHQIHLWPGTPTRSPNPQWVDLSYTTQRTLTARQAGRPLEEFIRINHDVVASRFGNLTTVANWSVREPYTTAASTVVPNGFLAFTSDQSFVAGVFQSTFNGQPLGPGQHAIFLERDPDLVSVRHPLGSTTNLSVDLPANWTTGAPLATSAVDRDRNFIGYINRTIDGRKVTLSTGNVNGVRPSRLLVQGSSEMAVTDGASFQVGPIAPGQIVSLFANGIGPAQSSGVRLVNGRIATEANGLRVLFSGIPAPLLFVSANQINAVVPFAIASQDDVRIEVVRNGNTVRALTAPVVNSMPRIFTAAGTGSGAASALNADGSLNTRENPVARGSVVVLYATGGGLEAGNPADAVLASDASRTLLLPVTASVDGRAAEVLFAGAAPGFAGLTQINVRIPSRATRGAAVPIQVRVGNSPSQSGVTIAID